MQEPKIANCAFCDVDDATVVVVDEPRLATPAWGDRPHAANTTATPAKTMPMRAAWRTWAEDLGLPIEFMGTSYAGAFIRALTATSKQALRRYKGDPIGAGPMAPVNAVLTALSHTEFVAKLTYERLRWR